MTELKTLKDFDFLTFPCSSADKRLYRELIRVELKQEAIKWTKANSTQQGLIDAWFKFFNITSEDLK